MDLTRAILLLITGEMLGTFIGINMQNCPNDRRFGADDYTRMDDRNDENDDQSYVFTSGDFVADCCGFVYSWRYDPKDHPGGTVPLTLEVWEAGTGTTHTLRGSHTVPVTSDAPATANIPTAQRIPIMPGYMFGWWNPGQEIIGYRRNEPVGTSNYMIRAAALPVGSTQDWASATTTTTRSYALRIHTGPGSSPSFTGPYTGSVMSTDGVGVPVTTTDTIAASDPDPGDDALSITMDAHSMFDYDSGLNIVNTNTITVSSGTQTLTFRTADACGNTASTSYVVTIINAPPVFDLTPASTNEPETSAGGNSIFDISVTDADPLTCDLSAAAQAANVPFEVKLKPASTDYGIYVINSPGFNYTLQNLYTFTVECTDGVNTVESGLFNVNIDKNLDPSFVNIQNSTVISSSIGIGAQFFTVLATDPENDEMDFSLVCDIPGCPFMINANGEVKTTRDIVNENVVAYDVMIYATDGRNTIGPSILTITIGDINNPVTVQNLPLASAIAILENLPTGTSVYDVDFTDVDAGQSHTFWMTATPSAMLPLFNVDPATGIVTTATVINLEALTTATVTLDITVSDFASQDTQPLQVTIINVNEAPSFAQNNYSLSATDGPAGYVLGSPPWGITDPDVGDSYTISMDCGAQSAYFYYNQTTNAVTYMSEFDLDTNPTMPMTANCIMTATDAGGLTDTATLDINIVDINDNTPIFNPSVYNAYVSPYSGVGTTLTVVTATDADYGTFGDFVYSIDQSSLSSPQLAISSTGVVTLMKHMQDGQSAMNYSSRYTVQAWATDTGGLNGSAVINIIVSDTTTTTQATTTFKYKEFFDMPANTAWFVVLILLLAFTLGVTIWTIYTCKGKYGCKQTMRTFSNKKGGRRSFGRNQIRNDRPDNITSIRESPPEKHSWQQDTERIRY